MSFKVKLHICLFSKHLGMKDFATNNRRVEDEKQILVDFPSYIHMKEFSTKPQG